MGHMYHLPFEQTNSSILLSMHLGLASCLCMVNEIFKGGHCIFAIYYRTFTCIIYLPLKKGFALHKSLSFKDTYIMKGFVEIVPLSGEVDNNLKSLQHNTNNYNNKYYNRPLKRLMKIRQKNL